MGEKGAKATAEGQLKADLFLEKLSPLGGVTSKKMFGGHGIFHDGSMFGIVDSKGVAFLKAKDEVKDQLIELGGYQHSRMPYYSVSVEVMQSDSFIEIAKRSLDIG